MKDFVWSGRDDDETAVLLGNSVLGYKFDAKSDLMAVKFRVNLSKKKKKIASQPHLTIQDLERLRSIKLTKRNKADYFNEQLPPSRPSTNGQSPTFLIRPIRFELGKLDQ